MKDKNLSKIFKYISKVLGLSFEIFKPCVGDHCDSCSRNLFRVTAVQKGKGFKN